MANAYLTHVDRTTPHHPRLTWNGETHTLSEWAYRLGLSYDGLKKRLTAQESLDRVMTQPPSPNYAHKQRVPRDFYYANPVANAALGRAEKALRLATEAIREARAAAARPEGRSTS